MRRGFSVSATIEALQFFIPRTLCDELVVKGDDCPSWRVSLVVKFNIWLNKTRRVRTYSEISDFHTKQQQETKKKHQNHDRKTAHGIIADFVFVCRLKSTYSFLYFLPRKFYCVGVARITSPHRTSTGAGHVRTDGDYHLFTVLHHDGERANRTREVASPHSTSRAADKNIVFTTT